MSFTKCFVFQIVLSISIFRSSSLSLTQWAEKWCNKDFLFFSLLMCDTLEVELRLLSFRNKVKFQIFRKKIALFLILQAHYVVVENRSKKLLCTMRTLSTGETQKYKVKNKNSNSVVQLWNSCLTCKVLWCQNITKVIFFSLKK